MSDGSVIGYRKIQLDLLLAIFISIVVPLIIYFFSNATPLRFLLGLPYLFFVPGWALTSVIWVSRNEINLPERVAISIGLSILVSTINGIVLSSLFALTIGNLLISMGATTICISLLAWFKRTSHHADIKLFAITGSSLFNMISDRVPGKRFEIVSIIAIGIVICITLSIVVINLDTENHSTRFYFLDSGSILSNLSKNMTPGEHNNITLIFENWEGEEVSYRIDVIVNGTIPTSNYTQGTLNGTVENGIEACEISELFFTQPDRYRITFQLYMEGSVESSYFLHLWVIVS